MSTRSHFDFRKEDCEQALTRRFEQYAKEAPHQLALRYGARSLSYDVLNKQSNRLAHALLSRVTDQSFPVVLLLRDPIHHVVAQLGVLKAGKFCVPVDASFPAARQRQILTDSGARLVVAERETSELVRGLGHERGSVLTVEDLGSDLSEQNTGLRIPPECLAYVLYTSGSTGSPKGIMQSHRNLLHVAMLYHCDLGIGPWDRVTSPTSPAYTGTVWALLSALMNGAAFVFTSLDSASTFVASLDKEEITVAQLIVTLLRQWTQALDNRIQLPRLRLIYTGGETLHREDVDRCARILPDGCGLVYDYGSTEAGIITHHDVDLSGARQGRFEREPRNSPYPVGHPVADTEVFLVDEDGGSVAPGQDGEIAVRSMYLSQGYWRDLSLTQKHFLPGRTRGMASSFRTGDLGRIGPDGSLLHLGRKDFQVKVRGYRINLTEIENALCSLHGVAAAAVSTVTGSEGTARLVAYIQQKQPMTLPIKHFREKLSLVLPSYMIPSWFMNVDRLPVSANGKLDRSALPAPPATRPTLDTEFVPPETDVEHRLARIWAEILCLERIGLHDNLFEVGGDSLTAMRIVTRVLKDLRSNIPLNLLLQAPSIAEMAALITKYRDSKLDDAAIEKIVSELESMSEEEVRKMLSTG